MVFTANKPQPGDKLSASQPVLLANNLQLDASFANDHYAFSNLTSNNGKHSVIHSVNQGSHPTTIANEPALYANEDTANIGVIQYSRGPSDAVPTPITCLQSPSTPITLAVSATTNMLDFTGIALCTCEVYAIDSSRPIINKSQVIWNGSSFIISSQTGLFLGVQASGNILRLVNHDVVTLNNVYWTLRLWRVQI